MDLTPKQKAAVAVVYGARKGDRRRPWVLLALALMWECLFAHEWIAEGNAEWRYLVLMALAVAGHVVARLRGRQSVVGCIVFASSGLVAWLLHFGPSELAWGAMWIGIYMGWLAHHWLVMAEVLEAAGVPEPPRRARPAPDGPSP